MKYFITLLTMLAITSIAQAVELKVKNNLDLMNTADTHEAAFLCEVIDAPNGVKTKITQRITNVFGKEISPERCLSEDGKLMVKFPSYGYYQVHFKLVDENNNQLAAAKVPVALVRYLDDLTFDEQGMLGLNGQQKSEYFKYFRRLGCTMWRFDLFWEAVENKKDVWDFSHYDNLVDKALADGVLPFAILCYNTPYLQLKEGQGTDHERYLNYVRTTVERYKDKIHHWDLWNEPQYFWRGGKEEFGILMNQAYKIIKEIQPDSFVNFNGYPFEDELVGYTLENLKPLNGDMPFDSIGVHPYSPPRAPELNNISLHLDNIYQKIQNMAPGKKLWISEVGWPTSLDERGVSELKQGAFLQRAAALGIFSNVSKYICYQPFGWNDPMEGEAQYGLLNYDFTPKAAIAMFATFEKFLNHAQADTQINVGEAGRILVFKTKDKAVAMVWGVDAQGTLNLPEALPQNVSVFNGDGSDYSGSRSDLSVGDLPLFLMTNTENRDSLVEMLGKGKLKVDNALKLKNYTMNADGLLLNFENRTLDKASVKLACSNGDAKMPKEFKSEFAIAAEPVEILIPAEYLPNGNRSILNVELDHDGIKQTVTAKIESGKIAYVDFDQVDGNVEKWKDIEPIVLDKVEDISLQAMRNFWHGANDLSGKFYLGWNEKGLMVLALVKDNIHENNVKLPGIWAQDSFQVIFVLTGQDKVIPNRYNEHTLEAATAMTSHGEALIAYVGKKDNIKTFMKRDEENKISTYELFIPWDAVESPREVKGGDFITLAFLVNDYENNFRKVLQSTSGLSFGQNPQLFTRYELKIQGK